MPINPDNTFGFLRNRRRDYERATATEEREAEPHVPDTRATEFEDAAIAKRHRRNRQMENWPLGLRYSHKSDESPYDE